MSEQDEWTQERLVVEFPDLSGFQPLGRGGFATVYEARHPRLGVIALKVLTGSAEWNLDDTTRRRFWEQVRIETQAIGSLSASPNIVTLHTSGVSVSGWPYLIMELCPGGTLGDLLRRQLRTHGVPFDGSAVFEVGEAVSRALAAAHRDGILHLDVKPANVLLSRFGVYKLSDFGIAQTLSDGPSGEGDVFLTPHYAAPELWEEHPRPTAAADVYALGSTLYQMASLQRPFEGSSGAELALRVRSEVPQHLASNGIPQNLADLIQACLEKRPGDRPDALTLVSAFRSTDLDVDATRTIHTRPAGDLDSAPSEPDDATSSRAAAASRSAAERVPDDHSRSARNDSSAATVAPDRPAAAKSHSEATQPTKKSRTPWLVGVGVGGLLLAAILFLVVFAGDDPVGPLTDDVLIAAQSVEPMNPPTDPSMVNEDPGNGEPTAVRIDSVRSGIATLSWEPDGELPGADYVVLAAHFPVDPDLGGSDSGGLDSTPSERGLLSASGEIATGAQKIRRWSAETTTVELPVDVSRFTCFKVVAVTSTQAIPSAQQVCAPTDRPAAPVIEAVNVDATNNTATVSWSAQPGQESQFLVMEVAQRDEQFVILKATPVPANAAQRTTTVPREPGSCFVVRAENAINLLPSDLVASTLTESPSRSARDCSDI